MYIHMCVDMCIDVRVDMLHTPHMQHACSMHACNMHAICMQHACSTHAAFSTDCNTPACENTTSDASLFRSSVSTKLTCILAFCARSSRRFSCHCLRYFSHPITVAAQRTRTQRTRITQPLAQVTVLYDNSVAVGCNVQLLYSTRIV